MTTTLELDPGDPIPQLQRAWSRPRGFIGWLRETDHNALGKRYIVTALVMFGLGGILAVIMRLQLATPNGAVVGADRYNQIFTTHGTTMMFLFAVPIMRASACTSCR